MFYDCSSQAITLAKWHLGWLLQKAPIWAVGFQVSMTVLTSDI